MHIFILTKKVTPCNGQSLVVYHVYEIVVVFFCGCFSVCVLPLVKCLCIAGCCIDK